MIIVSWFYFKAFIDFIFGNKNSIAFLCYKSLMKFSFYLPSGSQNDRLVGVKILKSCLLSLLNNNIKNELSLFKSCNSVIYDTDRKSFEGRKEFLNRYGFNTVGIGGVFRDEIIGHTGLSNLLLQLFGVIFIGFFTSFICFFYKKNRISIALLPKNYLETIGLYLRLREHSNNHKIKVYYFSIYNQNSNIDAWIARSLNLTMIKIPSEVPLAFNNSILISDSLAICFPYQKEEVRHYVKSILIGDLLDLGPESTQGKRLSNEVDKTIVSVSFYSSGFWLRKALNHPDVGMNSIENEDRILKWLLKIASELKFKLNIYLHPLEKKEPHIIKTNNYYEQLEKEFGELHIINIGIPSNEIFSGVEVGIGLFSTILFERLYLKCPTLIVPLGTGSKFPLENSPINNICCRSYDELRNKIRETLELTNNEFFKKNCVDQYSRK